MRTSTHLREILRDIGPPKQAEAEREHLIANLQEALSQVKVLRGLLPICAPCKKIRDEKGHREPIESYIVSGRMLGLRMAFVQIAGAVYILSTKRNDVKLDNLEHHNATASL